MALAVMPVGLGYLCWLKSSNPEALQRGATMPVGRSATAEGDVDWSSP